MVKNNVFVFIFILFVYGWMIYLKTLWLGYSSLGLVALHEVSTSSPGKGKSYQFSKPQLNTIGGVVFLNSAQSV